MTDDKSRFLMAIDRAVGISSGLKLVAVFEADDGITVRELTQLLNCGRTAAKSYITAAVSRGWLHKTGETRETNTVYRRTASGNLLTSRLIC